MQSVFDPLIADKAVQQAAFIALLAGNEGLIGKQWNNRTTEITAFSSALTDAEAEHVYDAETRREFCVITAAAAQDLRRQHDEVRWAARFLLGETFPFYSQYCQAVDLRLMMERAAPSIETQWNSPNTKVMVADDHALTMLSALTYFAQHLSNGGFHISVENETQNIHFIFSGDMNPAYFTDPNEWFTINQKRGSESIRLFLARELAQRYDGRVWVETANKTRFDFRLSLPMTQEAAND